MGEIHLYTEDATPTFGTQSMLTASLTFLPGKQLQPPHQHADEEFKYVIEGEGTWSLNGNEQPLKAGDLMYTRPWDWHGIRNSSDKPLRFFVFKFRARGVPEPSKPALSCTTQLDLGDVELRQVVGRGVLHPDAVDGLIFVAEIGQRRHHARPAGILDLEEATFADGLAVDQRDHSHYGVRRRTLDQEFEVGVAGGAERSMMQVQRLPGTGFDFDRLACAAAICRPSSVLAQLQLFQPLASAVSSITIGAAGAGAAGAAAFSVATGANLRAKPSERAATRPCVIQDCRRYPSRKVFDLDFARGIFSIVGGSRNRASRRR